MVQELSEEFLLNRGYLPDGDVPGEFAKVIYGVDEAYEPEEPHMHVVINVAEQSVFIEAYATSGQTLAVVELGQKTQLELIALEYSLRMI